jgi:hypothetical protein
VQITPQVCCWHSGKGPIIDFKLCTAVLAMYKSGRTTATSFGRTFSPGTCRHTMLVAQRWLTEYGEFTSTILDTVVFGLAVVTVYTNTQIKIRPVDRTKQIYVAELEHSKFRWYYKVTILPVPRHALIRVAGPIGKYRATQTLHKLFLRLSLSLRKTYAQNHTITIHHFTS